MITVGIEPRFFPIVKMLDMRRNRRDVGFSKRRLGYLVPARQWPSLVAIGYESGVCIQPFVAHNTDCATQRAIESPVEAIGVVSNINILFGFESSFEGRWFVDPARHGDSAA